jgi:hypothetical protein
MAIFYQPGRYCGRITRQQLGETKNGNAQLVLSFTVFGKVDPKNPTGDLLEVEAEYEKTIWRVITAKTIDFVKEDLAALGYDRDNFADFDERTPNFFDLREKEIEVRCDHELDQNKKSRERWSIARANNGPPVKPLDDKDIRKLDALYGKALKGLGAKPQPPAPDAPEAKPAAPAVPPADQDRPAVLEEYRDKLGNATEDHRLLNTLKALALGDPRLSQGVAAKIAAACEKKAQELAARNAPVPVEDEIPF